MHLSKYYRIRITHIRTIRARCARARNAHKSPFNNVIDEVDTFIGLAWHTHTRMHLVGRVPHDTTRTYTRNSVELGNADTVAAAAAVDRIAFYPGPGFDDAALRGVPMIKRYSCECECVACSNVPDDLRVPRWHFCYRYSRRPFAWIVLVFFLQFSVDHHSQKCRLIRVTIQRRHSLRTRRPNVPMTKPQMALATDTSAARRRIGHAAWPASWRAHNPVCVCVDLSRCVSHVVGTFHRRVSGVLLSR